MVRQENFIRYPNHTKRPSRSPPTHPLGISLMMKIEKKCRRVKPRITSIVVPRLGGRVEEL